MFLYVELWPPEPAAQKLEELVTGCLEVVRMQFPDDLEFGLAIHDLVEGVRQKTNSWLSTHRVVGRVVRTDWDVLMRFVGHHAAR